MVRRDKETARATHWGMRGSVYRGRDEDIDTTLK
jgi:hypothetical protein